MRALIKALEETLLGKVDGLEAKVAKLETDLKDSKEELVLCQKAIAQTPSSTLISPLLLALMFLSQNRMKALGMPRSLIISFGVYSNILRLLAS